MQETESILRQVKIDEATITLRRDGIVHVLFNKGVTLDLKLQMLLLNIYNEITNRKKHPFIFEAFDGVHVTREARDNAVRIEPESPGSAYAVVAASAAYRLSANFYLNVRKPKSPYKVFRTKEEAIKWLKTLIVNEN
ncbi:MAG: DUF7793 family protein [Bacteroidia bacterium]